MKKSVILISVLIISVCLSISVLGNGTVTLSDSFDKLEYNGTNYSRFSSALFYDNVYDDLDAEAMLSAEQKESIQSIDFYTNEYENVIEAFINYKDGSIMSIKFLQDKYLKEYNEMLNKTGGRWIIDFVWPNDNTVEIESDAFGQADHIIDGFDLFNCDCFDVFIVNSDDTIKLTAGALIALDGEYFYVDYNDIDVTSNDYFEPSDYDSLPSYRITNTDLIEKLEHAEDLYLNDGLNFLLNEDTSERIAKIFFAIIFGILPCILAVIFLIIFRRSRGVYKKLYGTVTVSLLATSVLFTILYAIIMHYN